MAKREKPAARVQHGTASRGGGSGGGHRRGRGRGKAGSARGRASATIAIDNPEPVPMVDLLSDSDEEVGKHDIVAAAPPPPSDEDFEAAAHPPPPGEDADTHDIVAAAHPPPPAVGGVSSSSEPLAREPTAASTDGEKESGSSRLVSHRVTMFESVTVEQDCPPGVTTKFFVGGGPNWTAGYKVWQAGWTATRSVFTRRKKAEQSSPFQFMNCNIENCTHSDPKCEARHLAVQALCRSSVYHTF